jgi:hypothetical protein
MGFIPIFVALLGLVLLYTLYTYNQIKPRKTIINQIVDQMAANSTQRKKAIFDFDQQLPGSSLAEVASQLKRQSTDRFQSYQKENELIKSIEDGLKGLENEKLKEELHRANETQRALLKKLTSYTIDYNKLISQAPASFVATAFGFKAF